MNLFLCGSVKASILEEHKQRSSQCIRATGAPRGLRLSLELDNTLELFTSLLRYRHHLLPLEGISSSTGLNLGANFNTNITLNFYGHRSISFGVVT